MDDAGDYYPEEDARYGGYYERIPQHLSGIATTWQRIGGT